jgi:hypothetical protein
MLASSHYFASSEVGRRKRKSPKSEDLSRGAAIDTVSIVVSVFVLAHLGRPGKSSIAHAFVLPLVGIALPTDRRMHSLLNSKSRRR